MLVGTAVVAAVLVLFIDGMLHLVIFLSPRHLGQLRANGWRGEPHDRPWYRRVLGEVVLLFDFRAHESEARGAK
ncbi:hypothetical protein [Nocardia alni]|uniref:hypothetical protein n=1 Tax=Nocardia alni TaxID=2815723 RepID=UPI001C231E84|nr:hypothetical protein [Nocardia alni]